MRSGLAIKELGIRSFLCYCCSSLPFLLVVVVVIVVLWWSPGEKWIGDQGVGDEELLASGKPPPTPVNRRSSAEERIAKGGRVGGQKSLRNGRNLTKKIKAPPTTVNRRRGEAREGE